ncbi:hypothetical protein BDC45DRAFT_537982 [Circinella umbellata]|nr:hypothetical protein BDC45DRAFT_537982 [Circinella umbellata]
MTCGRVSLVVKSVKNQSKEKAQMVERSLSMRELSMLLIVHTNDINKFLFYSETVIPRNVFISDKFHLGASNRLHVFPIFIEASCHVIWNKKKITTSTTAPSMLFTKYALGPKKKVDWSLLYICDHSHKLSSIPPATKKHQTNLSKHTGCTAKIKATKHAVDNSNVLKIPAALHVHHHDNVNQIQQLLNNISRKHRINKQSTQAWINILKEKGYNTLFEIINTSEAEEKANGSKEELLMVV